jgi:hypothetical protein
MTERRLNEVQPNSAAAGRAADHPYSGQQTATALPPQEAAQPDPVLRLSFGKLGGGTLALVAAICAVILGIVFYGLNGPIRNEQTAGAPMAASPAPAARGKSGPAIPSAPQTRNSGHS